VNEREFIEANIQHPTTNIQHPMPYDRMRSGGAASIATFRLARTLAPPVVDLRNRVQLASRRWTEMPRSSKRRRMVSSIRLFGHEAPAVTPTVTLPEGSQSGVSTSLC